ncbi:transposase [Streptomyces viridochromogenes]|uniref:transposase n=1 Tax=Streptomyces viridochromogenes TaxID=1938 RepID=UPI002685C83D
MEREPLSCFQAMITGSINAHCSSAKSLGYQSARSATGGPGACDLRKIVNAIFYQNRTGCQRCYPSHDFPAGSVVFYYLSLWRENGSTSGSRNSCAAGAERARRLEDPSLMIIDTQSVRAAAGVPKATTGLDADKKVSGRDRGLAVDVLGLITGVVVLAASAHENAAGTALLGRSTARLMSHRRLAREYDHRPDTSPRASTGPRSRTRRRSRQKLGRWPPALMGRAEHRLSAADGTRSVPSCCLPLHRLLSLTRAPPTGDVWAAPSTGSASCIVRRAAPKPDMPGPPV